MIGALYHAFFEMAKQSGVRLPLSLIKYFNSDNFTILLKEDDTAKQSYEEFIALIRLGIFDCPVEIKRAMILDILRAAKI